MADRTRDDLEDIGAELDVGLFGARRIIRREMRPLKDWRK